MVCYYFESTSKDSAMIFLVMIEREKSIKSFLLTR